MKKKNKKGFALAGIILVLAVIVILIPAFIGLIKKEAKSTNDESMSLKAFHLAESGQDRGIWKLRESAETWNDAVAGTSITGYAGDVEYAGPQNEGIYKIIFSSGPAANQVTIISKGKANDSNHVRAIRAIYSPEGTVDLPAISVDGALQWKPNMEVHWGPVITYTAITQAPGEYYPRKYSAGQITGRDTVNDSNNGALPSGNWVSYDYAAFQDLGTPPSINLAMLEDEARKSCVPPLRAGTGSGAATHVDAYGCSSGYYTSDIKIQKPGGGATTYSFNCSTCVIFTTGEVKAFANVAWLDVKALVAISHVDFNARSTNYTATIPSTASDEYQYSPDAVNYWTSQGWTNGGTANLTGIGMHGFLYTGGNFTTGGGGSRLVGAIYIAGTVTINTFTIYYDEAVALAIPVNSDGTIYRQSWDEINTSW